MKIGKCFENVKILIKKSLYLLALYMYKLSFNVIVWSNCMEFTSVLLADPVADARCVPLRLPFPKSLSHEFYFYKEICTKLELLNCCNGALV